MTIISPLFAGNPAGGA
jgi:hypothetical protein